MNYQSQIKVQAYTISDLTERLEASRKIKSERRAELLKLKVLTNVGT